MAGALFVTTDWIGQPGFLSAAQIQSWTGAGMWWAATRRRIPCVCRKSVGPNGKRVG